MFDRDEMDALRVRTARIQAEIARAARAASQYRGSLDRIARCRDLAKSPRAGYLLELLLEAVEARAMADAEAAWESALTLVHRLEDERHAEWEALVAS